MTTAVVPLRGMTGKTRLAEHLDAAARRDLVALLFRHVVATVLAAGPVRDVVVVTQDPAFAATALPADPRVAVVAQPGDAPGLDGAVDVGRRLALDRGAGRVLVVHADLPLLTEEDVRALLSPGAAVVLGPDRAGTGTNALVLDAAARGFATRFGPGSRAAHEAHAATLGLPTAVVRRTGTATDLDTPADWAALPAEVRERLTPPSGRGGPPPRQPSAVG